MGCDAYVLLQSLRVSEYGHSLRLDIVGTISNLDIITMVEDVYISHDSIHDVVSTQT